MIVRSGAAVVPVASCLQLGKTAAQTIDANIVAGVLAAVPLARPVTFDIVSGDITYNAVTSKWTLLAGKKYLIQAQIGGEIAGVSNEVMEFELVDVTNGISMGGTRGTRIQWAPLTYTSNVQRGPVSTVLCYEVPNTSDIEMGLYVWTTSNTVNVKKVYPSYHATDGSGTSVTILELT